MDRFLSGQVLKWTYFSKSTFECVYLENSHVTRRHLRFPFHLLVVKLLVV